MPIDWATVNWTFVVLMGVFAFVAALLGSLISFRNRFWGAVIGRNSVCCDFRLLESLSAPDGAAADHLHLHDACRLTFAPAALSVSASSISSPEVRRSHEEGLCGRASALAGLLKDGMMIMAGGFGLCGIPETLIQAIRDSGVEEPHRRLQQLPASTASASASCSTPGRSRR